MAGQMRHKNRITRRRNKHFSTRRQEGKLYSRPYFRPKLQQCEHISQKHSTWNLKRQFRNSVQQTMILNPLLKAKSKAFKTEWRWNILLSYKPERAFRFTSILALLMFYIPSLLYGPVYFETQYVYTCYFLSIYDGCMTFYQNVIWSKKTVSNLT